MVSSPQKVREDQLDALYSSMTCESDINITDKPRIETAYNVFWKRQRPREEHATADDNGYCCNLGYTQQL